MSGSARDDQRKWHRRTRLRLPRSAHDSRSSTRSARRSQSASSAWRRSQALTQTANLLARRSLRRLRPRIRSHCFVDYLPVDRTCFRCDGKIAIPGSQAMRPPARMSGYEVFCGKPQVKCGECPNQAFIALSDYVIASHLRGADPRRSSSADFVAGVYPLEVDETCWFLAVDFDGDDWSIDALAFMETCRLRSVPAALERSRSGKGGHVWIFFSQPIPARDARQLGATLLTETLQRRPEVGFSSYDRMFPQPRHLA